MTALLKEIYEGYHHVFHELCDPRTTDYFLMSSPFPVLCLLIAYGYFVKVVGPNMMKDRKPFRLERIITLYNLGQIFANMYMFYQCVLLGWGGRYNWRCEPVDTSYSKHALKVSKAVHLYFLLKVADLTDTIFFVLRKKQSHISFLHLYHHAGMVMATWVGTKFHPGGHATFLGFVNTFVHVIMYIYYFITSLNPENKRYIWWKKHLTQLQMVQFLAIAVHASQLLYKKPCSFPTYLGAVLVPQNLFMFILFYDFYRKAYNRKKDN